MTGVHIISHFETGRMPHWRSAIYSGLVAGVVFLVLELILAPLVMGVSPWMPVRMIGAIVLGEGVLPAEGMPVTFNFGVLMVALAVHLALSALYGYILSLLDFRLEEWAALVLGAGFGLAIYFINFFGFTAVFPWFEMARGGLSLLLHLVFGVTAALSYKEFVKREIAHERHS